MIYNIHSETLSFRDTRQHQEVTCVSVILFVTMFPDDRPLWMQSPDELLFHNILWTDEHVLCAMVCLTPTVVTSGHGIILMLSAKVGIKSASASTFGLENSGALSWVLNCYLTG